MTETQMDEVIQESKHDDILRPHEESVAKPESQDSFLPDASVPVNAPAVRLLWKDYAPQLCACLAGGSIVTQVGINMAFSSILLSGIMSGQTDMEINDQQASWIASLVTISTPLGSLLSGTLMDKIGRKTVCKITSIPLILSWILITFVQNMYVLCLARILAGFGSGLSTAALMYISEVSHPKLRPMLLCLNSVFVALGILISCTFGLWLKYQAMAMTFAVLSLVSYMITWPLPESPYWLATFRSMKRAEEALQWLNRSDVCYQQELKRLVSSTKNALAPSTALTFKQRLLNLKKRSVVTPIVILISLFLFQQFSGAYIVIFYAVNLFQMIGGKYGSGISEYSAMVLLGVIRFVMSIVAVIASRRIGRRPLCIFSGLGMAVSTLVAAIYICNNTSLNTGTLFVKVENERNRSLTNQNQFYINKTFSHNMSIDFNMNQITPLIGLNDSQEFETPFEPTDYPLIVLSNLVNGTDVNLAKALSLHEHWLPLVCLLVYVFFSSLGFLVIPWTLIGELLPISIRGTCGGFLIAVAYVVMFIVIKTFPYFLNIVKAGGMFFSFSLMSFLGATFVYVYLPETLGKSFQEIEDHFNS